MRKRFLLFSIVTTALFNAVTPCTAQDFVWYKVNRAGGARWDLATDMIMDSQKNICLIGGFEQTAYFGKDSLVSKGDRDIFIAKYDNSFNPVWLKRIGGKEYDNINSITTDAGDNIIITGNYRDTVKFEETTLVASGYMNNFIAKYTPAGHLLWVKNINAETRANKTFVTLGVQNHIFCSGSFYHTLALADSVQAKGETDIYVSEYTGEGVFVRSFTLGGPDKDVLKDIKYKNGKLYLLCEFEKSFPALNDTLYSYGNADILTLVTDTQGNILHTAHGAGFFNDGQHLCNSTINRMF
jgi:hypothetical protein